MGFSFRLRIGDLFVFHLLVHIYIYMIYIVYTEYLLHANLNVKCIDLKIKRQVPLLKGVYKLLGHRLANLWWQQNAKELKWIYEQATISTQEKGYLNLPGRAREGFKGEILAKNIEKRVVFKKTSRGRYRWERRREERENTAWLGAGIIKQKSG